MKTKKQAKKQRTRIRRPVIEAYRLDSWFSADGTYHEHNTTRKNEIIVRTKDSKSKMIYLNADLRWKASGTSAPISLESARNLREAVYRWTKSYLVSCKEKKPVPIRCYGDRENRENYNALEARKYRNLSQPEREAIEALLEDCRGIDEPRILLVAQKNGRKKI